MTHSSVAGLASLRAGARMQGTLYPRFTAGESPTTEHHAERHSPDVMPSEGDAS